jgi:hypothetical protein
VQGTVVLRGQAGGAEFVRYRLEYEVGNAWQPVDPATPAYFVPNMGDLGAWDTTAVANGPYQVRLLVEGASGATAQSTITVTVAN